MQMSTQKKKSSNFDYKFAILILQMATVVVILLFGLAIRILGGSIYNKLSAEFHEKFDDITTADEVLDNKNDLQRRYLHHDEESTLQSLRLT